MTPLQEKRAVRLLNQGKSQRQVAAIIGVDKGQIERLQGKAKAERNANEATPGARYVHRLTRKAEKSLLSCLRYIDELARMRTPEGQLNVKVADAVVKGAKVAADIVDGWEPEVEQRNEKPPSPKAPEGETGAGGSVAGVSLLRRTGS